MSEKTSSAYGDDSYLERREVGLEPLLIGLREAASVRGVSRATIYRLVGRDGFPTPLRIGRRVLFRRWDLERWVGEAYQRSGTDRWKASATETAPQASGTRSEGQ